MALKAMSHPNCDTRIVTASSTPIAAMSTRLAPLMLDSRGVDSNLCSRVAADPDETSGALLT